MVTNFDMKAFCGSKYDTNEVNILLRIGNSLATALSHNFKLPRFIVDLYVLDDDFIDFVMYAKYSVSEQYGQYVESMVKNTHSMIAERKAQLPAKALKENYPVVYWVAALHNKNFQQVGMRTKFNLCLKSVVKLFDYMRVIKMKEIWEYSNEALVDDNGRFTSAGLFTYWKSVDAAICFNVNKSLELWKKYQEQRLHRRSPNARKDSKNHYHPEDYVGRFFNRRRRFRTDRFRWENSRRQPKLPPLPLTKS